MTHPTDALRLVPDDYVLVPREPTGSMLKAAFAAMNATPSGTWKRMKAEARHPIQIFNAKMRPRWSAMIGAAPSPRQIPWQHRQIEDDGVGGYRYKAAPASPLPGGGPHERWSILNHLGELWTPENFDTERQATAFLDRWKRDNPKMDLSKHKVTPVLVTMTAAPTGEPK